jgi:hypothetical protein
MHAFDFVLVLFSFVYAAAITHQLSTAGEVIIAAKRIRNARVQSLALVIQIGGWIWYFAALQSALSG